MPRHTFGPRGRDGVARHRVRTAQKKISRGLGANEEQIRGRLIPPGREDGCGAGTDVHGHAVVLCADPDCMGNDVKLARVLYRVPPRLADAVIRILDDPLRESPYRMTRPLGAELAGLRSGYAGIAFRVLVRIDDEPRTVYVVRMGYRAGAYRHG